MRGQAAMRERALAKAATEADALQQRVLAAESARSPPPQHLLCDASGVILLLHVLHDDRGAEMCATDHTVWRKRPG